MPEKGSWTIVIGYQMLKSGGNMRYSLKVAAICACVITLLACSKPDTSTLRIGTNVWPGYEPLYLAQNMGLTEPGNIRLIEFSSASQTMQAFRNNIIDGAALTLDEVFLLLASGERLTLLLVMDVSHGGDAIVAQKSINGMNSMAGKTFGVENNALGAYVLRRAFDLSKLDLSSVKVTSLAINEQLNAFKSKDVDAVVTFEPVLSELVNAGGKVIFNSRQIPNEIIDVLVIRSSYFENNSAQLSYLKDIWYQALQKIDKQPQRTAKVLGKRLRLNIKDTLKSYSGLNLVSKSENNAWLFGDTPKIIDLSKVLMRVMLDRKLLEKPVDYPSLIPSE